MQVPVAIALYFGGSIAMHVFQQDAVVSTVRLCALGLAHADALMRGLLQLPYSTAYMSRR